MALTLFGVTLHDAHSGDAQPGVEFVVMRELAALCGDAEYRTIEPNDATVQRLAEIISRAAANGPVLPAPVGVVFRSADSVRTWLELHYSALTEALAYVDNRVAARVHVHTAADPGEKETSDLVTVATEGLRALRRAAVASLPIRADKSLGVLSSAAFLIDELSWRDFAGEVDAQSKLTPGVSFELTGPWAPYDFVKMQLGA